MSRYRDANDWLDWARTKYEEAQERFGWSQSRDHSTMDSYSTLVDVLERGIRREMGVAAADDDAVEDLRRLADQMETLGKGGLTYSARDMERAAQVIRRATGR